VCEVCFLCAVCVCVVCVCVFVTVYVSGVCVCVVCMCVGHVGVCVFVVFFNTFIYQHAPLLIGNTTCIVLNYTCYDLSCPYTF